MRTEAEIVKEISLGEDSSRQFKVKLNNPVHIAVEICAMSNSSGGTIYIGINDDCTLAGLTSEEIRKYNTWIAEAASQLILPSVYPLTQVMEVEGKILLLVKVSEGTSKPYQDKQTKGMEFSFSGLPLEQVLTNMNIAKEGKLTLGGLLLFGRNVQTTKPFCLIRAIHFPGCEISDDVFIDKRDCTGTLDEQYRSAMIFLKSNLSHIQNGDSFNSPGILEIDEKALEEVVVNALLHRDYSKNAAIRLLIFKDRVEIINPGSLFNHLTVENIKNGNSASRNYLLVSFGTKVLPYSGIGSGIPRIIKKHPSTDFINDKNGEQFTVIMKRR
jgi:predicted HTH transcriptional regulator